MSKNKIIYLKVILSIASLNFGFLEAMDKNKIETEDTPPTPSSGVCMIEEKKIETLRKEIKILEIKIETLNINNFYNELVKLTPAIIKDQKDLVKEYLDEKIIYLPGRNIQAIPHQIGTLRNLTCLSLSSNRHLETIPPQIGFLTQLKKLYLYNCHLTTLPTEICSLKTLNLLYLHDNQLSILPKEIGNLSNLTRLSLNNNQLSTLPHEISNLKAYYLNLTGNPLRGYEAQWGKELNCAERIEFRAFYKKEDTVMKYGLLLLSLQISDSILYFIPRELINYISTWHFHLCMS